MEKCLKIRFPNGDIFKVPASVIAKDRANYYADIDGYEIDSNDWLNEFELAMNDEFELKDWLAGNMDWCDLEPHATKVDEKGTETYYENNFSEAKLEMCNES